MYSANGGGLSHFGHCSWAYVCISGLIVLGLILLFWSLIKHMVYVEALPASLTSSMRWIEATGMLSVMSVKPPPLISSLGIVIGAFYLYQLYE